MTRRPPHTRYAQASGAKIAYQVSGTGPPDLVMVPGLISHLDIRRRRHSAASSSDPSGFVVVAHPFHPLNGQRLEVLYVKRRGADAVFVCAGGVSGQITLPQAWTDRGEPPLARRLSAEGLAGLDTLIRSLQGR